MDAVQQVKHLEMLNHEHHIQVDDDNIVANICVVFENKITVVYGTCCSLCSHIDTGDIMMMDPWPQYGRYVWVCAQLCQCVIIIRMSPQ